MKNFKRNKEESDTEEIPDELMALINNTNTKTSKKSKAIKKQSPLLETNKEHSDSDQSDLNTDEEQELKAYLLQDQKDSLNLTNPELEIKSFESKKHALMERFHDIKLNTAWIDTQTVTTPAEEVDSTDDLKRELRFYQQALAAVQIALPKLKALGVKTTRPTDYFAEMVKSDDMMLRIRRKLVDEKEGLELSEKAKKQRLLKKFGKKGLISH
jgi:rRNA-processing protein EBP2